MKLKTFYIHCSTQLGIGLACFKGSDKNDAKRRFKKKYRGRIFYVEAVDNPRTGMKIEY